MPTQGTWYIRLTGPIANTDYALHLGRLENTGATGSVTYLIPDDPYLYLNGIGSETIPSGSADVATFAAGVPAGFTTRPTFGVGIFLGGGMFGVPATATFNILCNALGANFTLRYTDEVVTFGQGAVATRSGAPWPVGVPFGRVVRVPGLTNTLLLSSAGLQFTRTIAAASVGTIAAYDPAGTGAYLYGSYYIGLWYFNLATNHYQIASTPVPVAPWAVAAVDPVPIISTVQTPKRSSEGVLTAFAIPAYGCAGTAVTIVGTGFGDDATVEIGGVDATSVVVVDQTTITCVSPVHADGVVDVVVTNFDGTQTTAVGGYQYIKPWWTKTTITVTDGIAVTSHAYVQQCIAPTNDTWTPNDPPFTPPLADDPDGWYFSTAAFNGSTGFVFNGVPAEPRKWADIVAWAASETAMLGGSPGAGCVTQNRLVFPASNYTVGTQYPPIHVFDGSFDHLLCRLPPTTSDTVPKAVMSMLAANGTIYLTTFDSGTTSVTWSGRVFQLDLDSAVLTPIGVPFTGGDMPYALAWHMGRLWVGTNNGIGTVGKVYYFRPGIDTAWTLDHLTATDTAGGVDSMTSYLGKLYVGTDNAAGSRGKVLQRDSSGVYTVSETGSGGTAIVNNGYLAMAVFKGVLYASYWNHDATAIAKIRAFDGTTWTTAFTGATTTLRPFIGLLVDAGVLFAIGGGFHLTSALLSTTTGASWTNITANLPETDHTLLPLFGVVVA